MFGTVPPTDYDLNFQVFRIPVRVSVWFWVAGVVLGYDALKAGVEFLLCWLLVLFVSILVHELGHAQMARRFGYRPQILLYHFGGLAFYDPWGRHTRGRSILISLAGPGAGFVLYGLTEVFARWGAPHLYDRLPERTAELLYFFLRQMEFINLWWGLVNLLPVLPLDGGRVCEELCSIRNPRRGLYRAAQIGAVVGGLAAAYFFSQHENYPAILFAMLCAQNVNILQQLGGL